MATAPKIYVRKLRNPIERGPVRIERIPVEARQPSKRFLTVSVHRPSAREAAPAELEGCSTLALCAIPAPSQCPVTCYLAGLGTVASRERMLWALRRAASMLCGGGGATVVDPRELPWSAVGLAHFLALRQRLAEECGLSNANTVLAGVRGVLRRCVELGLAGSQALAAVASRGVPGSVESAGTFVSAAGMSALLSHFGGPKTLDKRNRAIVALLYYSGLRGCELRALDRDSLRVGPTLLVQGKGRKQRLVPVSSHAEPYLKAWLEERGELPGPLFWAATYGGKLCWGQRMSLQQLRMLVRDGAKAAELGRVLPHDLRRSFVSELLERGVDLARVQALCGHTDPKITAKYDRRSLSMAREAVERLPVLEWKEKERGRELRGTG